jgi:hypothetical protein
LIRTRTESDNPARLTGLARILTQYIAEPIMEHPMTTAMVSLIPGAGYVMAGMMGKDILEYSAQRAAELSLPPDVQKLAEQDPDRISGEQAAVEAAMLGLAPVVAKGVEAAKAATAGPPVGEIPTNVNGAGAGPRGVQVTVKADVDRGKNFASGGPGVEDMAIPAQAKPKMSETIKRHVDDVADAWQSIFAPANRSPEAAQAASILRATTGDMAASYEQAAFKLDEFRRAVDPLPEADKLGFIDAIEGGRSQPSPEFARAAGMIRQTLDDTRDAIRDPRDRQARKLHRALFPAHLGRPGACGDGISVRARGRAREHWRQAADGRLEGVPEAADDSDDARRHAHGLEAGDDEPGGPDAAQAARDAAVSHGASGAQ